MPPRKATPEDPGIKRVQKKVEALVAAGETSIAAALNEQDLLSVLQLAPSNPVRKRVVEALRRDKEAQEKARKQKQRAKESELVPIALQIGKGATMTIWTDKRNRE